MSERKAGTKELISSSLDNLKKVFENDTEVFLKDVNAIQQMNTNQSIKTFGLNEKLRTIAQDSETIKENNEKLREFNSQLSKLEDQAEYIEALTKELDEWTKELSIKARRLNN